MAECKFSDGGIKSKSVDASFCRINKHGRGAVNDIASSDLFFAFLQKILQCAWIPKWTDTAINTENSSNRNIDINIAAAIQRVDDHYIFGLVAELLIKSDIIFLILLKRYRHSSRLFAGH